MLKFIEKLTEHENACVGCGYCCMQAPCEASRRLYKSADICPQLLWNEKKGRYFCGLMLLSGKIGFEYRKELYAGAGCCSNLNSWRKDVKERSRGALSYKYPAIPVMFQAFLKAYGSEPFLSGDSISLLLSSYRVELRNIKYSEEEIEHIMRNVCHYIKSNKSSMFEGFV